MFSVCFKRFATGEQESYSSHAAKDRSSRPTRTARLVMRQLKPQISCFTLLQGALTTATICSNHRRLGAHQFVRIHLTFAARKGSSAGSRRLRAKLLATMTVLYAKALSIFLFPTLAVASVAPFWPLPTQYTVGSTPLALSSDFLFNVDTSSPILVQVSFQA